jgi:hypothetical protein
MPRLSWRKLGRAAAIALGVSAVVYEAGANLLLSSGAIAHLVSEHPDKLRLEYASARTFWPGRVHIAGFDLRGRDAHVEWQLHIDAADADISLLALLRRRFHVAKVQATGITLRVRFRLEPDAVNADRVARMPPIDGFDRVPLVGVPPETSDEKTKPWIIDIQKVDAQAVREVWIDAYRVVGLLRAQGGFTMGANVLDVAPASAEVQATALTTGDDTIAADVEGRIDAQLDSVDPRAITGLAVLHYLTMHSSLHGTFGGIRFIRHFVPDGSVALDGGAGTFRSEANVVHGLVTTGTSTHVEIAPATILLGKREIAARAQIDFATGDADGANATPWGELRVGLSDLAFTETGGKGAAVTCQALATRVQAPQIDLADPLSAARELAFSWDTARVDVLDLHAIDEAIPKDSPFHIEHGTATVSTRGRGSLLGASAEVGLESKLAMKLWGARLSSGVEARVPLKASFVARTLDLSGAELTLSDPALPGWWGKVKLGTTAVHVEPPSLTLAASTTARDGRPFLSLYAAMNGTSLVAKTALGVVPDPLIESMTADLHGTVRLAAATGAFDLQALDVQGAASRLRGVLKKRAERMDGGLLLEAGANALGISFAAGKSSLVLVGAPKWFETNVEH